MPWSKLDDKLHSSQAQRTAGLEAMGLWALAESYCGDQLTDGFVPAWWVFQLCGKRKGGALADRLVHANLWERAEVSAEKGWLSVDYLARNKSHEQWLADRANNAKRQAEWRQRQADSAERNGVTNGVTNSVSNACPDPTRPDQTRSGGTSCPGVVEKSGTAHARAREDDDFANNVRPVAATDLDVCHDCLLRPPLGERARTNEDASRCRECNDAQRLEAKIAHNVADGYDR